MNSILADRIDRIIDAINKELEQMNEKTEHIMLELYLSKLLGYAAEKDISDLFAEDNDE